MGKTKLLIEVECDPIALQTYGTYYAYLTPEEQSKVWKLAIELAQEKLNRMRDSQLDKKKEGSV